MSDAENLGQLLLKHNINDALRESKKKENDDKYPVKINDSWYTVGAHGFVYWFDSSGAKVRSTKPIEQVEAAVEARENKRKSRIGDKVND